MNCLACGQPEYPTVIAPKFAGGQSTVPCLLYPFQNRLDLIYRRPVVLAETITKTDTGTHISIRQIT